ncbi:hypothetical protein AAFN86_25450 [Roseomonas sp. CAU 1739]|uniref:hypothetical protein n=1 Tax=Roseomonas sp. CAU 1739 TaxID=3140364 RepID=UPI00325B4A06
MIARRTALLAGFGALAGCAITPAPVVTLPFDPAMGFADPARQAIIHTAHFFAAPGSMAGQSWIAAQAISEAEYLTVELNFAQRWIEMSPIVKAAFQRARPEWRAALGIDQAAQPQAVINALTAVRYAYGAQDAAAAAAALRPPLFTPGGPATIAILSALPPLPQAAWAAMMAQNEMWRIQVQDSRDNWE